MTPTEHTADLDRAERNNVFILNLKDRFANRIAKTHARNKAHEAYTIGKGVPFGQESQMWFNLSDALHRFADEQEIGEISEDTERDLAICTFAYLRVIHGVKLIKGIDDYRGLLGLVVEYRGVETEIMWNRVNIGFMDKIMPKPMSGAAQEWVMWHDA